MIYKSRTGIYSLTVCGTHMLVADRRLWDECPEITVIRDEGFSLWQKLENGADKTELIETLMEQAVLTHEEAEVNIDMFLNSLREMHYLQEEENDN